MEFVDTRARHERRRPMPRDGLPGRGFALRRDPYRYVSRRCAALDTDVFQARVMFRPTIFMRGEEAARVFYDPERFVRAGAAPLRLQASLFGRGGVQTLDGAGHAHRKALFLELTAADRVAALAETTRVVWRAHLDLWCARERIVLYDELQPLLFRAACHWAGVPLADDELSRRTRDAAAPFDAAGAVGPRHWGARLARARSERWMARLVEDIRKERVRVARDSVAGQVASFRHEDGQLLSPRLAAVELLNVVRPVVAVSVYVTWMAVALYDYPRWRNALAAGDGLLVERFIQEVRRYYPFFPAAAARVRQDFEWNGYRFPRGRRALLDLYGTNHDPRAWSRPEDFDPGRYERGRVGSFNLVPQGGGDAATQHRCPGEGVTLELMKVALQFLVMDMAYDVPTQDLSIDWRRLPALPRSRLVLHRVRRIA
jgi:fatty-acid peroxygenase